MHILYESTSALFKVRKQFKTSFSLEELIVTIMPALHFHTRKAEKVNKKQLAVTDHSVTAFFHLIEISDMIGQ